MTGVLVRTDDEVYRVDSVWLGPPRATFPWRARYVAYGVGFVTSAVVLFLFFTPVTYGWRLSPAALQLRLWLPGWG